MSTIKVSKELIKMLDKFQAEILLKYGKKIDKKSLVERAVKWALKNRDFIEKEVLNMDKEKFLKMLNNPVDWGIKDSSVKIDKYLYGG